MALCGDFENCVGAGGEGDYFSSPAKLYKFIRFLFYWKVCLREKFTPRAAQVFFPYLVSTAAAMVGRRGIAIAGVRGSNQAMRSFCFSSVVGGYLSPNQHQATS